MPLRRRLGGRLAARWRDRAHDVDMVLIDRLVGRRIACRCGVLGPADESYNVTPTKPRSARGIKVDPCSRVVRNEFIVRARPSGHEAACRQVDLASRQGFAELRVRTLRIGLEPAKRAIEQRARFRVAIVARAARQH